MPRTIWKFGAEIADRMEISLPGDAEVVHMAAHEEQPGMIWIWALVDPVPECIERPDIHVYHARGTGHEAEELDASRHLVTVIDAGRFVWHIFS